MEPLPSLPSLVNLTPAKRGREPPPEPPRDDGTGPLRFYCSKNDGVRAGKTPLLNEADRNECGGRSILGNFYKYPVTVIHNGVLYDYATAEHAYQALKYLTLSDRFEQGSPLQLAHIRFANAIGSAATNKGVLSPYRAYRMARLKEKEGGGLNMSAGADRTFATSRALEEMVRAYAAGVRDAGSQLSVEEKLAIMEKVLYAKFVNNINGSARRYLLSTGDRELIEHTTSDNLWGDGGDGSGANLLGKTLMRIRASLRAGLV